MTFHDCLNLLSFSCLSKVSGQKKSAANSGTWFKNALSMIFFHFVIITLVFSTITSLGNSTVKAGNNSGASKKCRFVLSFASSIWKIVGLDVHQSMKMKRILSSGFFVTHGKVTGTLEQAGFRNLVRCCTYLSRIHDCSRQYKETGASCLFLSITGLWAWSSKIPKAFYYFTCINYAIQNKKAILNSLKNFFNRFARSNKRHLETQGCCLACSSYQQIYTAIRLFVEAWKEAYK